MHAIHVGNLYVELVQKPIERLGEHLDVLVSSDDNYLSHGGGVSEALWTKAGMEVLETYVNAHRPALVLGDVFVTDAFGLDAGVLFHAVTVDFDANRRLDARQAGELYGKVLDTAAARGHRTLATPLLGSGAGKLGPDASARALAGAIDERASLPGSLERIVLVALEEDFAGVQRTLRHHLPPRPSLEESIRRAAERGGSTGAMLVEAWNRAAAAAGAGDPAALLLLFDPTLHLFLDHLMERCPGFRHEFGVVARRLPDGGPRFDLPRGLREKLSGPMLVGLINDAARTWEVPPPASLLRACAEAAEARTQLLSPFPGTNPGPLQRKVLRAVESILEWLAPGAPAESEVRAGHRPEMEAATPFRAVGRSARPQAWRELAAPAKDAGPSDLRTGPLRRAAVPSSGLGTTEHVRRLRDFLVEEVEPETLDELLDDLRRKKRHRGDDDAVLLEHCVSVADPVEFVSSLFTARHLRKALEARTSCVYPRDASSTVLARELLESLGYPASSELKGLRTVLRRVRQLRRDALTANRTELAGAVAEAASGLEQLLRLHLRFLCQAVFLQPPEAYLARSANQPPEAHLARSEKLPFDRRSLGTLLHHLRDLYPAIAEMDSPRAAPFRRAVKEPFPESALRCLPQLRNAFAHGRGIEKLTVTQAQEKAAAFFDAAITTLEYFARDDARELRIFPYVLRIDSIRVDRWGRRTVTAVSDEEEPGENLFTENPLRPGELYLMHPLTNPLRVDPILVPAGETDAVAAVPEPV